MNIQAIWENGVFRPIVPLTVKHTKLTIVVPDDEILVVETEMLPTYDLNKFSEKIRREVTRWQAINDSIMAMPFDDKENEEETEEQKQRWRAFQLRNTLRREQGRPV
jgi:predicted DNA-binding antitoxin AbrB/MazE fold protein